jgi:hypothetical protein
MAELDDIARRAIDGITRLAARATSFAGWVFVTAAVIGTTSFLLGLIALEGGIRSVWIVLGLAFGGIAVGGSLLARWRLASVGRHAGALVAEVVALLESGHPATRTMVDTVEADQQRGDGSVLVVSREFYSMRDAINFRANEFRNLMSAMTALTSFPALILGAIAITVVFAMLVPIFLLALAL